MDATRITTFIIRGRRFEFQENLAAGKLIHDIIWECSNSLLIRFIFKIDLSLPQMKLGDRDFHRKINEGFLKAYDNSKTFRQNFEVPLTGEGHEPHLVLKPNHRYKSKEEIIKDLNSFGAEKNYCINLDLESNDTVFQSEIMPVITTLDEPEAPLQIPVNKRAQQAALIVLCLPGKNEEIVSLLSSYSSQSITILEKVMALDLLLTMNALIYNKNRENIINALAKNVFFSLKSDSITIQEKQITYGIMYLSPHKTSYHLFITYLMEYFKEINFLPNVLEAHPVTFMPMYMQKLSNEKPIEINEYNANRQSNNILFRKIC